MSSTIEQIDLDGLISTYRLRNPRSQALAERARACLPGGNTRSGVWLHPFPPYIERAEGVYLHDMDGHALLDFGFNNSSMALGHAHPAVVDAVQKAAARGTGYNRPTLGEIELAELLQERMPSLELLRFCNSGTEAVIMAIRAAIAFTGRRKIAKMEGAYHGIGDHALVSLTPPITEVAGSNDRPKAIPSSLGLSGAADEVTVLPFNDLSACETLLSEHAEELAAVIVDPLMTNAGVMLPREGFLEGLRTVASRLGILLIFDEIVSFRVGPGGAQGLFNVQPDLTTLGKVAAGGTAGGVFGGRADVMSLYDPSQGPAIPHAGTFNANPITVAAGLTTLRMMTPQLYATMERGSQRVTAAVSDALTESGVEHSTNSIGSIFKLYFSASPPMNYRDTVRDDKSKQKVLFFWLLNHDIHWQAGGYISSVTEDRHLDELVSKVREGIKCIGLH